MYSLNDPRITPYLITKSFSILEDAVETASRISSALQSTRTHRVQDRKPVVSANSAGNSKKLPDKSTKCYFCKKTGHISRDCPLKKRKSNTKQVNQVEEVSSEADQSDYEEDQELAECQELSDHGSEGSFPLECNNDDDFSI